MAEKHDLIAQLLNKGGDVEQCLKLLKEVRESEEKVAEREERRAERELEKAKIEKEIRLKELEIKEKEVSLGTIVWQKCQKQNLKYNYQNSVRVKTLRCF